MASKSQFFLLALVALLAISGQVLAGRQIPNNVDVKQPDFLISDNSFLIPGIGRVLIPPTPSFPSYDPHTGIGSYSPGGDDAFPPIPNGGVSTVNHP
ncbi:cell wall protein [Populus alba x Populus x berolinensis]|nr:cell wall protein [Populus alba x Populus x berolinensis]